MSDTRHFPIKMEKSKCINSQTKQNKKTKQKKGNEKLCVKNHRPASLLPISCKVFEQELSISYWKEPHIRKSIRI